MPLPQAVPVRGLQIFFSFRCKGYFISCDEEWIKHNFYVAQACLIKETWRPMCPSRHISGIHPLPGMVHFLT